MKTNFILFTMLLLSFSFFSCEKDDDMFTVKDAKITAEYKLKALSQQSIPNTTKANAKFEVSANTAEMGLLKASIDVVLDYSLPVSEKAVAIYANEKGEKITTQWQATILTNEKKLTITESILSGTGRFAKIKGGGNYTLDFDDLINGSGTMEWIVNY